MGQGKETGDMSRAVRDNQGAVRPRLHEETEAKTTSALMPAS